MGKFSDSVKANIERLKRENQKKCYSIVYDLFMGIVRDTPVLDGYLRNNWFTSPSASFSLSTNPIPDKQGEGSLLNIQSLGNYDLFYGKNSIVTMANNLNYAYRIEYQGWSMKAPQGMVRLNIQRVGRG